ncbi:MAG: hypothetical protein H0U76_14500 [Ktedonobacteraceae bacterium]|nr:hypothetical protein [Ktedonobacteraceae bacterium]
MLSGIQACGQDEVVFVGTGSAGKAQRALWVERLSEASFVLQSFDDDKAGDQGAQYWLDNLPRVMPWAPWKNDLNDMLRDDPSGESIREWLRKGLKRYDLVEKAKKIPVKPALQSVAAPQLAPLQGQETRTPKPLYSYAELVERLEAMQQYGTTFQLVDGRVQVNRESLPLGIQTFIEVHTPLIARWLQSKQPQTCCKCPATAEHFSPSGYGYCTEHYKCAGGHTPRWTQYKDMWLCACVVDRMAPVQYAH